MIEACDCDGDEPRTYGPPARHRARCRAAPPSRRARSCDVTAGRNSSRRPRRAACTTLSVASVSCPPPACPSGASPARPRSPRSAHQAVGLPELALQRAARHLHLGRQAGRARLAQDPERGGSRLTTGRCSPSRAHPAPIATPHSNRDPRRGRPPPAGCPRAGSARSPRPSPSRASAGRRAARRARRSARRRRRRSARRAHRR